MTAGRASVMSRPAAGGGGGPLVFDSFNRADSATTMGTSDSGHVWVPNAGVWGISSNKAYRVSGSEATTVVESTLSDCTIHVTISVSGDIGLCWRSTTNGNYWMVASGGLIYRREAGGYEVWDDVASWADGDTMTVVLSGTSHTIKKNGTTVSTFNSAFNQTATKHGMWINTSSSCRFDDFSVTA